MSLNGRVIRTQENFNISINKGDEISFLPAIAGG